MTTSEQINEIAGALAKAQGEMEGAAKSAANPFFKSRYADLASVWDACREPLTKHGLSVVQSPTSDGSRVSVETILMHSSGQWMKDTLSATAKDDGPQAVGSIITYLRRYALQSFAGVAPEDDDAEAAQGRGKSNFVMAPPEPEGYKDWVLSLEGAAVKGTPTLQSIWKASKAEFRQHLTTTNPKAWERMKADAARVGERITADLVTR